MGEQSERQEGSCAGALPYRRRCGGGILRIQIEEEEKQEKQETASRTQGEVRALSVKGP